MEPCIRHLSTLKCKCDRCAKLKEVRTVLKNELCKIILPLFRDLFLNGYTKNESMRELRRELHYRNQYHYDLFEEVANKIWGDET